MPLEGSCSQNTIKKKRLEYQSYKQERNFIDRERLTREMNSGGLETGCSLSMGGLSYLYM
jgi:hypothetical protein